VSDPPVRFKTLPPFMLGACLLVLDPLLGGWFEPPVFRSASQQWFWSFCLFDVDCQILLPTWSGLFASLCSYSVSVYSVLFFVLLVFRRPVSFCLLVFRRRLRFLFMFCFCLFGSCCFWFYFVCCFCFLIAGDFAFWVFVTLFFVVVVVVVTSTVGRVSPGCLVRCRRTGRVVVAPM
jgi:hypothetical protein